MSKFECLYSFSLCSMDLGCPLLRGSSDRRLRRCAAAADISKGDLWWFFFLVKLTFCKSASCISIIKTSEDSFNFSKSDSQKHLGLIFCPGVLMSR